MRRAWRRIGAVVVATMLFGADVAIGGPITATTPPYRVKVGLGYHFSSGDYDSGDTTDIMYVPLTTRVIVGDWSAQLVIPYLRIDGPAGVIQGPSGPVETTDGKSDGLGDIVLRSSYTIATDAAAWVPQIEIGGVVKFPTASRDDGLGTGAFDFGPEVTAWWGIDRFTPFVTGGYRVLGSPPDTHLDDVFLGSVGVSCRFLDPLSGGMLLDYREASTADSGERVDLIPFATWRFAEHWSADTYASAGLAHGSPDGGAGLQIGYVW